VPTAISAEIDTDNCPPEEATRLKELVESSGVMYMQSAHVKGACDVWLYHLEIDKDGLVKRLNFDQISMPEMARPLIEFLAAHSKSMFGDD